MLTYHSSDVRFVSYCSKYEKLPFSRAKFNGRNWRAKMNLLAPVSDLHRLYFHDTKVAVTVSSK